MAFHYRDGWYFERLIPDGDVRIYHKEDKSSGEGEFVENDFSLDIDAASWASIVASVSKLGETSEVYHKAIALHQGDVNHWRL